MDYIKDNPLDDKGNVLFIFDEKSSEFLQEKYKLYRYYNKIVIK